MTSPTTRSRTAGSASTRCCSGRFGARLLSRGELRRPHRRRNGERLEPARPAVRELRGRLVRRLRRLSAQFTGPRGRLVRRADPYVDFSRFDADRDGVVDDLLVVHAGPGAEETGNRQDIWSHKWQMSDPAFGSPGPMQTAGRRDGGPVLGRAGAVRGRQAGLNRRVLPRVRAPARIARLVRHRLLFERAGRVLPDGGGFVGPRRAVGPAGELAGPSLRVAQVSARLDPARLDRAGRRGFSRPGARIRATAIGPSAFRLLKNPERRGLDTFSLPGSGEYFLVENRERIGFDRGLPGDGLLILHVDESRSGNSDEKHPLVGILQADGSPAYALPRGRPGHGRGLVEVERHRVPELHDAVHRLLSTACRAACRSAEVSAADTVMTAALAVRRCSLAVSTRFRTRS